MSSESVDGKLVFDGFLFCIPPFVLLVASLGLIGLKRISRLPRWAARLAAPPFYLVALPIATVITGLQVFAWMFLAWYLFLDPLVGTGNLPCSICSRSGFFLECRCS